MSRISIDMDGVLANFVRGFNAVVNDLWPGTLPDDYEPEDYNYPEILKPWQMDRAIRQVHSTHNFWLGLDAYSTEVGDLAGWLAAHKGHDLWAVTARQDTAGLTAAKQTELWLTTCGLSPLHNFMGVITVDGSSQKIKVFDGLSIQYSIDDRPDTVLVCQSLKGHIPCLLTRNWNKHVPVAHRVESMDEFLERIE